MDQWDQHLVKQEDDGYFFAILHADIEAMLLSSL